MIALGKTWNENKSIKNKIKFCVLISSATLKTRFWSSFIRWCVSIGTWPVYFPKHSSSNDSYLRIKFGRIRHLEQLLIQMTFNSDQRWHSLNSSPRRKFIKAPQYSVVFKYCTYNSAQLCWNELRPEQIGSKHVWMKIRKKRKSQNR